MDEQQPANVPPVGSFRRCTCGPCLEHSLVMVTKADAEARDATPVHPDCQTPPCTCRFRLAGGLNGASDAMARNRPDHIDPANAVRVADAVGIVDLRATDRGLPATLSVVEEFRSGDDHLVSYAPGNGWGALRITDRFAKTSTLWLSDSRYGGDSPRKARDCVYSIDPLVAVPFSDKNGRLEKYAPFVQQNLFAHMHSLARKAGRRPLDAGDHERWADDLRGQLWWGLIDPLERAEWMKKCATFPARAIAYWFRRHDRDAPEWQYFSDELLRMDNRTHPLVAGENVDPNWAAEAAAPWVRAGVDPDYVNWFARAGYGSRKAALIVGSVAHLEKWEQRAWIQDWVDLQLDARLASPCARAGIDPEEAAGLTLEDLPRLELMASLQHGLT